MFPRPRSRIAGPAWLPLWVVPLVGIAAFAGLAWSLRRDDRWVKEEGGKACVASGLDEAACEAAIDANHRSCMNYTFTRAGKHGRPRALDTPGYVECVVEGPEAFRAASVERRERREREGNGAAVR